jgi:hypothetical protein
MHAQSPPLFFGLNGSYFVSMSYLSTIIAHFNVSQYAPLLPDQGFALRMVEAHTLFPQYKRALKESGALESKVPTGQVIADLAGCKVKPARLTCPGGFTR